MMTDIERFMKFVSPEPNSGCWLWMGAENGKKYGVFWFEQKLSLAHRTSYSMFCEKIDDGICVLHKCDNGLCVNPDHLFLGTLKDNSIDMVRKGRNFSPQNSGEKNGNSSLTEKDAAKIAMDTRPQRAIAKDFGVSQFCVWSIKSGRTWRQ